MTRQETFSGAWPQKPQTALFAIIVLGFSLRIAAALILPDQGATLPDAIAYREAGHLLWTTGQIGSPFHMPLYPALIAVLGPGWPQLLADIVLSSITIWLIYLLARSIFEDERVALLAAAIAAIYPHFIFFSIVGLTETLFMALLVAAYVCWYRGMNAFGALMAVLGILTRPTLDIVAPFLVLYFSAAIQKQPLGGILRNIAVYVVIYCAVLAPWWLHNYKAYGTFVRLNLGGGLALLSGNNPNNQTGGFDANLGANSAAYSAIANPVARDEAVKHAVFEYIKSDPQRFLAQAVLKFLRFWRPWPYAEPYSNRFYVLASGLSFGPVLIMSLAFFATARRVHLVQITPILFFIAYLTAIHMVFPASIRYRLPLEPFLTILAAAGTVELARRWQTRGQLRPT